MAHWKAWLCLGALGASVAVGADKPPKLKNLKPGFNMFSKEQDVQLGKESAAEVEKQMQVITDPRITALVEHVGKTLLTAPEAEAQTFAYSFKVVNDKSINAFALPGGPTFTHTGLIAAADNESQIAGVLAHEISHVILRHGTSNVSKANLLQIPAMLGGAIGGGGLLGQLAQMGVGLGANSIMLKFSRSAESDADAMGTRIMHKVGYNPIEMARFFEKLEAESAGKPGMMAQFFSDHPNPGNRVTAVQKEIQLLPKRGAYDAESGSIAEVKRLVAALPAPPPPPKQAQSQQAASGPSGSNGPSGAAAGAGGSSGGGVQATGTPNNPAAARPNGQFQEFKSQLVSFQYPANWHGYQDQKSGEVTLTSPAGAVGESIGYGAIVNFAQSQSRPDIAQATQQLVQQFQQRDPNLKVGGAPQRLTLAGAPAMATRMEGVSAFTNNIEELTLITVEHTRGLFYMLLIAPSSERQAAQQSFNQMVNSLRLAN